MVGVLLGGQAEDKAVFKELQSEAPDIAGIRGHVVHKAVQGIDVDVGVDAEAEELGLVDQPGPAEQLHGVVGVDGLLLDGQRGGGQLPHPLLHPAQQGLVQGEISPGQEKEGAAEGVLHGDAFHILPARHVIEGLQHQEDGAALIGLDAGPVLGGDHFQRAVPIQNFVELAELPVTVDQQDVVRGPALKIRRNGAVGRSVRIGVFHAVHGDLDHFFLFHRMASFYM